jgi:lycopene cyclase domain-containing protein
MPIYAIFLIITGTIGLLLNQYYSFRLFRRWRGLLAGYLVIVVPFLLWDVIATRDGHWAFNPEYILGPKILGLPLEEIAFFFVVPFVMSAVWMLLRIRTHKGHVSIDTYQRAALVTILLATYVSVNRPYTFIVTGIASLFVLVTYSFPEYRSRQFWIFQFWLFTLFFISNTILTFPAVVTYGEQAILGLRIGSIPIEDFLYNFILVNGFIFVFSRIERLRS